MRTKEELDRVFELKARGFSQQEIAEKTGIPKGTIKSWLAGKLPSFERSNKIKPVEYLQDKEEQYLYLLGLYLGHGYVGKHGRGYRLRIFLKNKYPLIQEACMDAMSAVFPQNSVGKVEGAPSSQFYVTSNALLILFPQAGPGRKHNRLISLQDWQKELVEKYPKPFIKGLLQSDGGRYTFCQDGKVRVRYQFFNKSVDIKRLFKWACSLVSIDVPSNIENKSLYVSKQADVAVLDSFIGPKA